MERETSKNYDSVRILRSLERAYSIAPLSHGRRPFAFVTEIYGFEVHVTAVFVFNDDGTLAGCLGEVFFGLTLSCTTNIWSNPLWSLPPPPPLQQAYTTPSQSSTSRVEPRLDGWNGTLLII